jgi:FkbM family methyltransferase
VVLWGRCQEQFPRLQKRAVRELHIRGRLGPRSIFLRANGIDARTFWEVLVAEVYGASLPLRDGATVIDAGANIGLTSVFFLEHAADVRVIAIEPDTSNCSVFRRNLSSDQAVLYEGAIGADAGAAHLELHGPTSHELVLDASEETTVLRPVRVYTLDELAEREGIDRVDVLKVDIEGTERLLFERVPALVRRTDRIVMEIHGPDNRPSIVAQLGAAGFRHIPPTLPGRPDAFERNAQRARTVMPGEHG